MTDSTHVAFLSYDAHTQRAGLSMDVAEGDTVGPLIIDGGPKQPGMFTGSSYGWVYFGGDGLPGIPNLGYGPHVLTIRCQSTSGDGTSSTATTRNIVAQIGVPDPPPTFGDGRLDYHHPEVLLPFLWNAGFRDHDHLMWGMAIAEGESGLWPHARNWLPSSGFRPAGTVVGVQGPAAAWDAPHLRQGHSDRGLFQINSKAWPKFPDNACDDPAFACALVWAMTRSGSDWSAWGFGAGAAHYARFFDGDGGYPPLRPLVAAFLASK